MIPKCPPETSEEWWSLVDHHWANLVECFSRAGAPLDSHVWRDGPGMDETHHPDRFIVTLEKLKHDRNPEMARMLQLCWMAAPDHPEIHSWPSWGVLCDLCSENWCLFPEGR